MLDAGWWSSVASRRWAGGPCPPGCGAVGAGWPLGAADRTAWRSGYSLVAIASCGNRLLCQVWHVCQLCQLFLADMGVLGFCRLSASRPTWPCWPMTFGRHAPQNACILRVGHESAVLANSFWPTRDLACGTPWKGVVSARWGLPRPFRACYPGTRWGSVFKELTGARRSRRGLPMAAT